MAKRSLDDDVRLHLLDEWERVRKSKPTTLSVYAPAAERSRTDEAAVSAAVRSDLQAHTGRLRRAAPLSRRDRVAAWIGVVIFLLSIAISTTMDRLSTAVLVVGISQGIVVVGWVALWDPVQRVAGDILPHEFARRRYAEFADIPLRFAWQDGGRDEPQE